MIQLVLIVLPCTLVGTAAVLLVQRLGWLPQIEQPAQTYSPRRRHGTLRPLAVGAIVIMSGWILFWLLVLAVGINVISSAS